MADEADGGPPAAIHGGVAVIGRDDEPPVWNALDINAWYYNLRADDLFSLSRWMRLISSLSERSGDPQTRPQRKLNQSLSGLATVQAARLVENGVRDHFDNWLAADTHAAGAILDFLVQRSEERLRRRAETTRRCRTSCRL